MSSWLSLGRRRRDGEEASEAPAAPPPELKPSMDPEEIRRRRLARLEAAEVQQRAAAADGLNSCSEPQPMDTSTVDTSPAPPLPPPPPNTSNVSSSVPDPPPLAPTKSTLPPTSASSALPTPPSTSQSSSVRPPAAYPANQSSVKASDLAVHRLLQRVLLISNNPEDTSGGKVPIAVTDPSTLFSISMLSEILCARLADTPPIQPSSLLTQQPTSLLYLAGCYRRYEEEERMRRPGVSKEQFKELEEQLRNFSVTAVTEPDVFGLDSEEVRRQFVQGLLSAGNPVDPALPLSFLQILLNSIDAAELPSRLAPIVSALLTPLANSRLLSDPGIPQHLAAIKLLLSTHLGAVEALVNGVANFTLPSEGLDVRPLHPSVCAPRTGVLMPSSAMFGRPQKQRTGAAHEQFTTLGLMFRVGLPADDPSVTSQFEGMQRRTRAQLENIHSGLRQQLLNHQTTLSDLLTTMLKAGSALRSRVVQWFQEALALNHEAEKSRPNPHVKSSDTFLLNLTNVLLTLSAPFILNANKRETINTSYLCPPQNNGNAYPPDLTLVKSPPVEPQLSSPPPNSEVNFVTQCFFLTYRALHLGPVQCFTRRDYLNRNLGFLQNQMHSASGPQQQAAEARFYMTLQHSCAQDVQLCETNFLEKALTFVVGASHWLQNKLVKSDNEALAFCQSCPEHFFDDLLDIVLHIEQYSPKTLSTVPLADFFTFCMETLNRPHLIHSPHLRAKFGDILYRVFLPPEDRLHGGHGDRSHMAYTGLLLSSPVAQEMLGSCLLRLYGDVEQTGYYDKFEHRYHIAAVLKYLWKSAEHRRTFRRISADTESFVVFANGLMNETNSVMATVMEKLPEIRTIQQQQRDPSWGQLPEQRREELLERHRDNERQVTSQLQLCNEVIHMVMYLTSDDEIRKPFLSDKLCGRLANMLLSIVDRLVGSKGLEIKVDNPEQLNFMPKQILFEVSHTILHFAPAESFQIAVSESGYYKSGMLSKVQSTMRRLGMMTEEELEECASLEAAVAQVAARMREDEICTEDAPDDFIDPLLQTLMRDPVKTPSGFICDRSSIEQHLLNQPNDPISRAPLCVADLVPQPELKGKIEAWVAEQRNNARRRKEGLQT